MKTITFRQLQTNTSWLAKLPVTVVRYGKPIAQVSKISEVPDSPKIIQKKEKDPSLFKARLGNEADVAFAKKVPIKVFSDDKDKLEAFMALRQKLSKPTKKK